MTIDTNVMAYKIQFCNRAMITQKTEHLLETGSCVFLGNCGWLFKSQ